VATYRVVRPIEHNNKLYIPAGTAIARTVKSASHGGEISVDDSGTVELTPQEAARFTNGQIVPVQEGTHSAPAETGTVGQSEGPDFMPTPIQQ